MIPKVVLGAILVVLMIFCGTATYVFLGTKTSKIGEAPQKPTAATPRAQGLVLPGTLYVVQQGALYSLSAGRFRQLTAEAGWMQPSLYPDGSKLIVIKRGSSYSDVYVLNRFGTLVKRLTNNSAPPRSRDTGANHWAFYPRISADGKTLWLAYDQPKFGFDVVMSIWAMPLSGTIRQGKLWTNADDYTGGDVEPLPVRQGGVIWTKYSYGPDVRLVGQLYYTNVPFTHGRVSTYGRALTNPGEDCRSPAISPSGTQIAMICTYEKQVSYLVVASWNGKTLGPRKAIITNQLVAQPTWAPDGSGIAYLAPGVPAGPFQLWFLPKAAYTPSVTPSPSPGASPAATASAATPSPAAPVKPIQLTTNDGFDATSAMAWAS